MMSEREKRLICWLLENGKITEENLFDDDYYESEIEQAKDKRYWQCIYDMRDRERTTEIEIVLNKVLGKNWIERYDYSMKKERGKYRLSIYLTDEEFEAICKKAQERR